MSDEPPPAYTKDPPIGHRVQRNGIPPAARRSMEDESRPLPEGWVRQFDAKHGHQYFVDTGADPPRSIWHHPHDDETYLNTLNSEERERLQELHRQQSHADIEAELTDEEDHAGPSKPGASGANTRPPPVGGASSSSMSEKPSFGRKWKDKLTNSTHEEREQRRREREAEERKAYEQYRVFRVAMARAMETGQPQKVGRDSQGHDIYVEPPRGPGNTTYGYPGTPNYRGYNPYQHGVYTDPNARFVRPQGAYGRPYGAGYGGGYGLPLAGGLAGGLLFGSLLGGGF